MHWTPVLAAVGAILSAKPSPPLPFRDSGLFLYVASIVRAGGVPYRDVWDHKPPLVYYIDAIGLALGGSWGVWLLQLLVVTATVVVAYSMLRRAFGRRGAIVGAAVLLCGISFLLDGGNLTEEYALLAQVAALRLFVDGGDAGYTGRRMFLIGILAACAALLKPTLVAIWLAGALYVTLRRRSHAPGAWIAVGFVAGVAPLAAYLAAEVDLPTLWRDLVEYNLGYAGSASVDGCPG